MVRTENFDRVQVESAAELRGWLVDHHEQHDSVWLSTGGLPGPGDAVRGPKQANQLGWRI